MDFRLKIISFFEIWMIILAIFSFSYVISETNVLIDENINYYNELIEGSYNGGSYNEGNFVKYLRVKILDYLSSGIVSAQTSLLSTCIENLEGTICQEYPNSVCDSLCTATCFPGTRELTDQCRIGTCVDPVIGVCNEGTPKQACLNAGNSWSLTSPAICNKGCCLINYDGQGGGDQAQFTTESQCNYVGQTTGAPILWDGGIGNEVNCLIRANSQAEGACVLDFDVEEQANNCEFTTQSGCILRGGEFNQGILCSNPDLNTVCEITQETSCFADTDEVFYMDSCGNKANIYDSTKLNDVSYWSNKVNKEDSCSLDSASNPYGRQSQCGNCNYLTGSICGAPKDGVDDDPIYGDFVCKDLSCVDEWGNDRKQGESWCAFDGKIGVDKEGVVNEQRSVDVPGSRHYQKVCFDGEVRTSPCADARQQICVEEIYEETGISSAACRNNMWSLCIDANNNEDVLAECEKYSDCKIKRTEIGDYKFDVCVPKYPPGLDMHPGDGGDGNELLCSLAGGGGGTSTGTPPFVCTRVEVKGLGGWSCEANCDCTDIKFTEAMNNFCMSLGDCGAQVNVEGKFSDDGYRINSDGEKLSGSYENSLKTYADVVPGQFVDSLRREELEVIFPNLQGLNDLEFNNEVLATIGQVAGALGSAVALIGSYVGLSRVGIPLILKGPGLSPLGGAISGALMGAAVVAMLLEWTGVAGGLPEVVTYGLIVGGAIAGGIIGYSILSAPIGVEIGAAACVVPAACIIILAIIVIIIILSFLGIGDVREIDVEFSCLPWQPPTGGSDCEKCNDYELGCSNYKCESLGQNCEFINEGTSDELCYDSNPNDVTTPVINVWEEVISEGEEYVNSQENIGVEIKSTENSDGYIKEYTPVNIGLKLNEPAQCKWDKEHTATYDEMSNFFGGNSYLYEHEELINTPTLESLGVVGVDPARRGEYEIYVRCRDGSGNPEGASLEYVIKFFVRPADDFTAPQISKFVPANPGYVGLNVINFSLIFFTNEPADCKWDLDGTKEYENMQNHAGCLNGVTQGNLNGWVCQTELPVGEEEEMNYYFKCKDQPWLEGTDRSGERIVTGESTLYKIIKTTEELVIDYIYPDGEIITSGTEPVPFDLEIRTSGGINGNAACKYRFGEGLYSPFFNTGEKVHRQEFNTGLYSGIYNMEFSCTDIAENVATANSNFEIFVDNQGPLITRVYQNSGNLNVITNENSECSYSLENCAFSISEGIGMSGSGKSHTTSIINGQTYKIKCEDTFGNVGMCLSVTGGY